MTAVIRKIIDPRRGSVCADIDSDDGLAEHALEMMRDKSVSTTDVEHVSTWRQNTRDFECHVVSPTDLASSSRALEASFDRCS